MKKEYILDHQIVKVFFGEGVFDHSFRCAFDKLKASDLFIITDKNVSAFYKNKVVSLLSEYFNDDKFILIKDKEKSGINFYKFSNSKGNYVELEPGEDTKSQSVRNLLENELIKREPTRKSVLMALGGGVVGDIGGYLASTIFRGIKLIQIPTSLLAMIDSSIGGKNGINLKFAKNVIGTIYQPKAIFIDPLFLNSLPRIEFLNGFCEIVKIFANFDKTGFQFIEKNIHKIFDRDKEAINYIIRRAAHDKFRVVQQDVTEKGLRTILNFGHTIGHAIEITNKSKIKHGFAILIGMLIESENALMNNLLDKKSFNRLLNISKKILSEIKIENLDLSKIQKHIRYDKKRDSEGIKYAIMTKIGKYKFNVSFNNLVINKNYI